MHSDSLQDGHGRRVSYLRVSVTDRCNLRCTYCVSQDMHFIPHPNILRYEEILRVMELGVSMGVDKVRFTGGEPFVRKGFTDFLVEAARQFPDLELCATTNGTRIGEHLERLAGTGVRLNVSLDTLQPDKFRAITGRDLFHEVRANIDRCLDAGIKLKVNVVAMGGVNSDELADFVAFAEANPLDLRFIEFMPIGDGTRWSRDSVWLAADIVRDIRALTAVEPLVGKGRNSGPARMFNLVNGQGRIGVISPYSNHFCATCNRLRLTSDGDLRTCLFSDKVFRLRPALRNPRLNRDSLERIVRAATVGKPMGHRLLENMHGEDGVCHTRMSAIGG
ncbi:GTP 3',8-cyclase MoaA [Pseudodesulfovibrio senegalensis]|jgi:cyclic pyranopterin phosphate synthase|uniref:GTP 3',8-cyclase n=1 Tax=Pseudodesulfovibrio senegalensis TaxID=1721087 RepID=A0A6N6N274_9BACT|nr:GTP 3',8-cyclase MoaA [Pseudodesulfovibrio senegalensis]KAB1441488.1 GTP 3',8-cyclase MoaA [Pseudodesulfovibrio senegalensis]